MHINMAAQYDCNKILSKEKISNVEDYRQLRENTIGPLNISRVINRDYFRKELPDDARNHMNKIQNRTVFNLRN